MVDQKLPGTDEFLSARAEEAWSWLVNTDLAANTVLEKQVSGEENNKPHTGREGEVKKVLRLGEMGRRPREEGDGWRWLRRKGREGKP